MDIIEQLQDEASRLRRSNNDGNNNGDGAFFVDDTNGDNDSVNDNDHDDVVVANQEAAVTVSPADARRTSIINDTGKDDGDGIVVISPPCPPHPSDVLRSDTKYNKSLDRKQPKKTTPPDDLYDVAVAYLCHHAEYTIQCPSVDGRKDKSNDCSCFSLFKRDQSGSLPVVTTAVARFMVFFAKLPKAQQQRYVVEWIRYASMTHQMRHEWRLKHCRYLLPVLSTSDDIDELNMNDVPLVCRSAIQIIIGKARKWWTTCSNAAITNTIPEHGLTGRAGNHQLQDIELITEDLHNFFNNILSMCDVIPTRFVRERTGQLTTRDNNDYYTLPPYWSKRLLYSCWCFERGYLISHDSQGITKKTDRGNVEHHKPCASWTFLAILERALSKHHRSATNSGHMR
jgi:hypothetical protein